MDGMQKCAAFLIQFWIRTGLLLVACCIFLGCAGGGTVGAFWATLTPETAEVPQLGTKVFEARTFNASTANVVWSLREGVAAGSIATNHTGGRYFATYTAPNQSGVFHLDATVTMTLEGGFYDSPETATITVP
jgi:hypothetical protein